MKANKTKNNTNVGGYLHRLVRWKFKHWGWVRTENVNNAKYIIGVGVDPYSGSVLTHKHFEIRIYLIWWQIAIFFIST